MAFSQYKRISQVQEEYDIVYQEDNFTAVEKIEISQYFLNEFEFNKENMDIFTSEASRSEIIIFPLLREVYKNYYQQFSFWVQKSITYNEKLTGTPDYIVSTKSPLGKTVLSKPLVILVEAKRSDFEEGWGQCLSELVAAQKINGYDDIPVYGIVTDGVLWQFGKLVENLFTKNIVSYTIDDLTRLLGALNFIFQSAGKTKPQ